MRKKYFITTSLMVFVSLVLFFTFSCLIVNKINTKNTKREMLNYLQIVLNTYDGTNMEKTSNVLHEANENIRITFINSEGTVLYDTHILPEDNHLQRPEIIQLGSISYRHSDSLNMQMVYIAGYIKDVYIRIAMPESSTGEIANYLILFGFIALVIICAISFIIIQKVSNHLVKPINEEVDKLSKIVGNDVNCMGDDVTILSHQIDEVRLLIDNKISKLSEEKDKLNYIIQNMHQGLVILNGLGEAILINDTACTILERIWERVINCSYTYLFSTPIIMDKIEEARNQVIEDSLHYSINHKHYILNISSLRSNFASTKDQNGVAIFIIDITNDMVLQKTKSDFFANASHELKSPLTCIIGYQQMITEGILDTKEQILDSANKSLKEAIRMNDILSDMLSLATIEARQTSLKENINPKAIIEDVVITLSIEAKKNNIKISTDLDDNTLFASRTEFNEVVRNLIDNAIKYNKENGTIFVSYKDGILIVKDTGIGIKDEDKSRIFERFYRVDKARSKKTGGTGLGLAIVKHICLNNNYKLDLDSRLGLGTTFKIYFK